MLPIILVILVVGGVGGYLYVKNKGTKTVDQAIKEMEQLSEEGTEQTQGGADTGSKKENYSGTLKKMVDLGIPLKCTFSQNGGSSGTTWVKGEKFYTEMKTENRSGKIIFKNDCMWNWSEGEKNGIKMCFDPEEADEMFSGQAEAGQTNLPTDVDFNCKPAVFTDAKFNPPSSIEFMDMDEMMQQYSQ